MSKFDRLHLHIYNNRTQFNLNNTFGEYSECQLESIYVHNSFYNVSAELGNNKLWLTDTIFLILNDGYYDLPQINRMIKYVGTSFFKFILGYDSQTYRLYEFTSINDYNSENLLLGIDRTTLVFTLSPLNQTIYDMTFFGPI